MPETTAGAPARGHVVVVHRDPSLRALVAEALRDDGFAVTVVPGAHTDTDTDALEALAALAGAPPDLVLLDVDGPEHEARLMLTRRYGESLPVVALTTSPSPQRDSEIGAAALLPLPFELDDLLAIASRYCAPR